MIALTMPPALLEPFARVLLGAERQVPLTLRELAAVEQVIDHATWDMIWKLAMEER